MEPDHLHRPGDHLLVVGQEAGSIKDSIESVTEKAAQVKNLELTYDMIEML